MKKFKVLFWVTTIIIFLFEGVLTAFTFNDPATLEGFRQLGYPSYFSAMLMVFKVLGSLALVVPQVPSRVKEWAYAGFGLDFIAAFVSMLVVGGASAGLLLPVVFMALLIGSYVSWNKLKAGKK